jgi:hypothetical protein
MRLDQGQAGAQIEITPDMIEAGVDLLGEWDSDFYEGPFVSPADLVAEIFRRMFKLVSASSSATL